MDSDSRVTGLGESIAAHRARALSSGGWIYHHPFTLGPSVDRNRWLVDFVRGRRVIHVGCATEGETALQYEAGRLLFAQLESVAAAQLGVDPDSIGTELLRDLVRPHWPLQTCFLREVASHVLEEFRPEVILVPETLEHVPDAGSLLSECAAVARRFEAEIVVTVPNALSIEAVMSWFEGVDYAHPDHVATYTPRILQTLLEKTGLVPQMIQPYTWGPPPTPSTPASAIKLIARGSRGMRSRTLRLFHALFAHRFPDGWIAIARVSDSDDPGRIP